MRALCLVMGGPASATPALLSDPDMDPDIAEEAVQLVQAGESARVTIRLLGGVAVRVHGHTRANSAFDRPCNDIDVVTTRNGGNGTGKVLVQRGYVPHQRFNALNGSERLVFYDKANGRHVDVFVGHFRMCHELPVAARLQVDRVTIPLAELLLTKLQVVHLTDNDVLDIAAILFEHDIAETDDDAVNGPIIATLLGAEWGLWRTSTNSLAAMRARLGALPLSTPESELIRQRIDKLVSLVDAHPKSLRWRARARIGERIRWYQQPEEVAHQPRMSEEMK
jgi:hypothetical protein